MSELRKCSATAGGYAATTCEALDDATDIHPTKRSKGLFYANISRKVGDDWVSAGTRVTAHSGIFVGDGICLNFCPFCGGELRDSSGD